MLPTVSKTRSTPSTSRPNSMFPQYLRRIVKWQQMDIEYTFWQMLHLCTAPKVVYQHTKYHKQTKNQWARDDPAFVVICSLLLAVATIAYCAAFLTNAYLREEAPNSHVVEQRVEWLYAFDVHCNSFFPMFVMLYVIHYFVSPLLVAHGFIPELLSNLLFMVAASYYHYLNFLGYDVLPFLERTTFFLYPIGVIIVLSPILILSGFNPSRYFMNMYFSQRV
ncbi:protein unc-50 homolog isoform X4 [Gossypium hirsutum]|uniref:Protein unc-50 homolog isoform X4 n=1 Tax=Gossypium hirsutum TaxID=3635 RepID=A0ABM3BAS2_GOSHI|nr:protein unc-50 homolog isoform X4 [Gossypium hirsutum]